MTIQPYEKRLATFQKHLIESDADCALISKKSNIHYLTGYASLDPTGREAYLLVTKKKAVLYHTPFIPPPGYPNKHLITITMSVTQPLRKILTLYCKDSHTLGVEKLDLTVSELEHTQTHLPDISITSIDEIMAAMRKMKDGTELEKISLSCRITAQVMDWISLFIKTKAAIGITETEFAHRIEQKYYEFGADGLAFPTIVAFDEHSASPHHVLSSKKLTQNSVVLVDMGAQVSGYMGDMTRTWCLAPNPSPLFIQIEQTVLQAYQAAVSLCPSTNATSPDSSTQNIAPHPIPVGPVTAAEVDIAARNVIEQAGFGDLFIHRTGHGLGLEIHEPPSLHSANQDLLQPGMVITIEPGIYIPGKFGYRHEDTFLVTGNK